jgi:hypothetical protein
VRRNDRDFRVGDWLLLQEYEPDRERYTGRILYVELTYVLEGGQFGIESGFVVLGFRRRGPRPVRRGKDGH